MNLRYLFHFHIPRGGCLRTPSGLCAVLGLLTAFGVAQASNIFDEDWVAPPPLKSIELPAVAPQTRPAAEAGSAAPSKPRSPDDLAGAPGIITAPAAMATAARRPIPASAEQAKSRKLFKDLFSKELKDRSPKGRHALATKLLDTAADVNEAASDQFVLLIGATEAGKDAADLALCGRAADALADTFDIDALRLKSDAATKMSLRADSPAAAAENCLTGLALADQLIAAGDYVTAGHVLQSLRATSPEPKLTLQIQKQLKDLDALKTAAARVTPALAKLKAEPDDAEASLAVGQYLCFLKDDWKRGLPFLAKGKKPGISETAAIDEAGATDSTKQADIGNQWWALADKETGPNQVVMRQRAASWYSLALQGGDLVGLTRVLVEKRVAAAPPKKDPQAQLARSVLSFADEDHEEIAFRAISHGKLKLIDRSDVKAALADPHLYAGFQIVVWSWNQWRYTPAEQFTPAALAAMQQFVRNGGDIVIYEQWATENMGSFDQLFNIKTSGAAGGANILLPALKAKAIKEGLTEQTFKDVPFYNSYLQLPPGSTVLVRNSEDRDVVAIAPYGRGRLILIGTNHQPIANAVLDLVYHWKAALPPQPAADHKK